MENAGAYIPAPTPETGHVFARSHSQKPARFPAKQKERSLVETLLFPVSRGCRYNTLYFASKVVCQGDAVPVGFPATKPPVSLDSSGQRRSCPPLESTPKAKRNVPAIYAHSILLFLKNDSESIPLLCHFSDFLRVFTMQLALTAVNRETSVKDDARGCIAENE